MKVNKINRNPLFRINNYQLLNILITFALILLLTTCSMYVIKSFANNSKNEIKK